jgi:hypothetical protein
MVSIFGSLPVLFNRLPIFDGTLGITAIGFSEVVSISVPFISRTSSLAGGVTAFSG